MNATRYGQVRDIFLAVYELPPVEREPRLDAACGDDVPLRREVEALLARHDEASPSPISETLRRSDGMAREGATAEGAIGNERLQPGQVFAERYRIVALLGEGGMGQVYRAEDETLGVPVAIKILPNRRHGRERLFSEVRMAREVTHRAVCRVHDVGEWRGEAFITMEYVAGEDLAALLPRIGRMPPDKVLDIARQLCGGLAAAHARGVLHRDLKPGNVLIDPEGQVRIADFGIAVGRHERHVGTAGTPAYMAPELMPDRHGVAPQGASESSDLYALGVLLYELAAGRLPFAGPAGPRRPPTSLAELAPGLDPALEQAIFKCLAADPAQRPASALALAAALPGADALALAAEVDVTPSPDLVAAAGDHVRLSRAAMWASLPALVLLLGLVLWAADAVSPLAQTGPVKAPQALADRAQELLMDFGYGAADGTYQSGFLDDPIPADVRHGVLFWYRQQAERALPSTTRRFLFARPLTPHPVVQGQRIVLLDPQARLVYFQADPAPGGTGSPKVSSSEERDPWQRALTWVGIRKDTLEAASPGPSPVVAGERRAWWGTTDDGRRVRVDVATEPESSAAHPAAGGSRGRVVFVAVNDTAGESTPLAERRSEVGAQVSWARLFITLVSLAAIPLAYFNLRRRRVDHRGARRLLAGVLIAMGGSWLLRWGWPVHPMESSSELVLRRSQQFVNRGLWLWVGYLALEPYVRQIWPRTLVAWSRALEGRLRDPLVGRNVLYGVVVGVGLSLLGFVEYLVPGWLGLEAPFVPVASHWLQSASSASSLVAVALNTVSTALYDGFVTLTLLVLMRRLFSQPRWAMTAFVVAYGALIFLTSGGHPAVSWWLQGIPGALIIVLLLVRVGFLAYVSARYVFYLLDAYPLTLDIDPWYAAGTSFVVALIGLLAIAAMGSALNGMSSRRPDRPSS